MRRKRLFAVAVPVLAAPALGVLLLAAATFYLHRRTPLTIALVSGVESVALKRQIQRYIDKERIAVEISELPYDELYCRVRRQVVDRAVTTFDVILIDDPWFEALGAGLRGVSVPDPGDFVPKTLEAGKFHGVQRALPYVANTQLLAYNDRLVRESCRAAPADWAQVMLCAVAAMRNNTSGMVMRARRGNSIVTDFLPLLWSVSPESLPERKAGDGPLFGGSAAVAVEQFYQLSRTAPLGYMAYEDYHLGALMLDGKAAMSVVWAAWAMYLKADQDLRFVELPGLDTGTQPALGAWLLAIPENARRPEQAQDLVRWLVARENLEEAAKDGNPPARASLLTAGLNPLFPVIRRSLEHARLRPRLTNWREVERELATALSNRLTGRAKSDVLQGIDQRVRDAPQVCETLR